MNCDILGHRKSLPMFVDNNFATTFKKQLNTLLSFLTQNRRGVQRFAISTKFLFKAVMSEDSFQIKLVKKKKTSDLIAVIC